MMMFTVGNIPNLQMGGASTPIAPPPLPAPQTGNVSDQVLGVEFQGFEFYLMIHGQDEEERKKEGNTATDWMHFHPLLESFMQILPGFMMIVSLFFTVHLGKTNKKPAGTKGVFS